MQDNAGQYRPKVEFSRAGRKRIMRADDAFTRPFRRPGTVIAENPKQPPEETPMKPWRKPRVDEIAVGLEINAYACAQV
jgi:coenzyme PQQ precursor peptide PqqA